MAESDVKKAIRQSYGKVAGEGISCGCTGGSIAEDISKKIGYSHQDIQSTPEGANLGLGCGNPVALASLVQGETVLDLGSGAGFDCFLAANQVGSQGRVIGVDMTPEMIDRAGRNAQKGGYENVEFRLGEIEHLPVADASVDAVISNCVINLSIDKLQVFREVYRVLKFGGRLMVSDIVLTRELPTHIKESIEAYVGCIAGAQLRDEYLKAIEQAGFKDVRIVDETHFAIESWINDPIAKQVSAGAALRSDNGDKVSDSIISLKVSGVKQEIWK
jgi:arsenite methyltransferase